MADTLLWYAIKIKLNLKKRMSKVTCNILPPSYFPECMPSSAPPRKKTSSFNTWLSLTVLAVDVVGVV